MKKIAVFLLLSTLTACIATPHNNISQENNPPSISKPVSKVILDNCADSKCLLDLAKSEAQLGNFQNKSNGELAAFHFVIGDIETTESIMKGFRNDQNRSAFYHKFGNIDQYGLNQFSTHNLKINKVLFSPTRELTHISDYFKILHVVNSIEQKNLLEAIEFVDKIEHEETKVKFLYRLSQLVSKQGDIQKAKDLIKKASNYLKVSAHNHNMIKFKTIAVLHEAISKKHGLDAARSSISNYSNYLEHDAANAGLVNALLDSGDMDEALKVTSQLQNDPFKGRALGEILAKYAEAGDIDSILKHVDTMNSLSPLSRFYDLSVCKFIQNGEMEKAKQVIAQIDKDYLRAIVWAKCGKLTNEIDHYEEALKELGPYDQKLALKGSFAEDMAKSRLYIQALKLLNSSIPDDQKRHVRKNIYSNIFNSKSSYNTNMNISELIEFDLKLSNADEQSEILEYATNFFVLEQTSNQSIQNFIQLTELLSNQNEKENLLWRIIPNLLYLGKQNQANAIVSRMEYAYPRFMALTQMAQYRALQISAEN